MNKNSENTNSSILDINNIQFNDIFLTEELQRLQDLFSNSNEVASLIVFPDGTPITKPSNFCRLCKDIIRKSEKGCSNCKKSDKIIGSYNPSGPIVQHCLSGKLFDAGASISVGGKHIASWLIGQIREKDIDEQFLHEYADEIGVDRNDFFEAYKEVPIMSLEKFEKISKMLFAFANELSEKAYNNLKLKIEIAEREKSEKLLRESEEKHRLLFETANEAIYVVKNQIIVFANQVCEQITGIPIAKLIGTSILDLADTNERDYVYEHNNELTQGAITSKNSLFKINDIKGVKHWLSVNSVRINWENGIATLNLATDITEKKYAEELFFETKSRLESIIDGASVGTLEWNIQTKEVAYNNEWTKIQGYTLEEYDQIVQNKWGKYIGKLFGHPEEIERIDLLLDRHFKGEQKFFEFEGRMKHKNGSWVWVHDRAQIIKRTSDGQPLIMSGFRMDISKRKEAEEALIQTQHNYESFFNTIDEFIFVLDENANIIHTNSTVIERLEYSLEEIIGMSVLNIHPKAQREEASRIVFEMLNSKAEFCLIPLMSKSGNLIPVETRVKKGIWSGKSVLFGVSKDISRIKLSEEKFSKLFYLNPSPCGLSDLETGKYVEVNQSFCNLFGFRKEEVIGKTAVELGILSKFIRTKILRSQENDGKISNIETVLIAKNGKSKNVILYAENIYVQDKKYRFTVLNDVTERKKAIDTIHESEKRYRTLFETSPSGIMVLSDEGIILEANEAISKTTLYSIDELIGNHISILNPPENHQKIITNINQIKKGEILAHEVVNRRKDGTLCTFLLRDVAITLPNGKKGILSVSNDITQRKQTEQALRESQERYSLINNASRDSIYSYDLNSRFTSANKSLCELLNLEEYQIIGKTHAELGFSESTCIEWDIMHNTVYNTNNTLISETSTKLSDGTFRYFEVNLNPLHDSNGKIIGIGGTTRDITDRKQTEESLKKSEERFRNLVWDMQVGVLLQGANSEVLLCNPKSNELLDLSENQLIGKTSFDPDWNVIHEDGSNFEGTSHPVPQAIATCKPVRDIIMGVFRPSKKDYVWLIVNAEPILNTNGTVRQVVCSFIDITELRKAQQEINLKNEQLILVNAEKDKFFSIMAHDLRTPFTTFLGLTQIMAEELPTLTLDEIQSFASNMKKSATNYIGYLKTY